MILDIVQSQLVLAPRSPWFFRKKDAMANPGEGNPNESTRLAAKGEAAKCPVDHKTRELWLSQARQAQQKNDEASMRTEPAAIACNAWRPSLTPLQSDRQANILDKDGRLLHTFLGLASGRQKDRLQGAHKSQFAWPKEK